MRGDGMLSYVIAPFFLGTITDSYPYLLHLPAFCCHSSQSAFIPAVSLSFFWAFQACPSHCIQLAYPYFQCYFKLWPQVPTRLQKQLLPSSFTYSTPYLLLRCFSSERPFSALICSNDSVSATSSFLYLVTNLVSAYYHTPFTVSCLARSPSLSCFSQICLMSFIFSLVYQLTLIISLLSSNLTFVLICPPHWH